jgi:hypothetical protein
MLIELSRSSADSVFNFEMVGKGLTGKGIATQEPPPAFLQVEPTRPFGDGYLMHARMVVEPGANRRAGVAGQIIHDCRVLGH